MPLYEYECAARGHRFELIQRFSDAPVEQCTACGAGPVHKLLSAPAIQFKGAGWYVNDYARKSVNGSSRKKSGEAESSAPSVSKAESASGSETSSAKTQKAES